MSTTLTTDAEWDDQSLPRVGPFATMAVGAAVGFAVGYLYLTEEGRRLRARLEPWLDQSVDENPALAGSGDESASCLGRGARFPQRRPTPGFRITRRRLVTTC